MCEARQAKKTALLLLFYEPSIYNVLVVDKFMFIFPTTLLKFESCRILRRVDL
jgi:hypothetical protein